MKKTVFIIFILFLFTGLSLFAEEEYNVNALIAAKDLAAVEELLIDYMDSEGYSELENELIKGVKKLIVRGDYILAEQLLELILNYNMDNSEAQDIYLSLKDYRAEQDRMETEKRTAEEERIRREEAARRAEELKVTAKNLSFNCELGAINFLFYQSQFYYDKYEEPKLNFKYGMSTALSFLFHHPYFATAIDVYLSGYFVNINPESAYLLNYKATFGFTVPKMRIPLYFTLGWAHTYFHYPEGMVKDVLITSLLSPTFGLRVRNFYFNNYIGLDGAFDFYLFSFMTGYFDAAFDAKLGLLVRIFSHKAVNFYIRTDLLATFTVGYGRLENNVKLEISAGMGINEK